MLWPAARVSDCSEKPCARLCLMVVGRGGGRRKPPQPYSHSKGQAGLQRKARPLKRKFVPDVYKANFASGDTPK